MRRAMSSSKTLSLTPTAPPPQLPPNPLIPRRRLLPPGTHPHPHRPPVRPADGAHERPGRVRAPLRQDGGLHLPGLQLQVCGQDTACGRRKYVK